LAMMLDEFDLSFSLPENLSAISTVEWGQLGDKVLTPARTWLTSRDFSVGEELAAKGYHAKHPVVLVPGVVSTGLESWSTGPEYRSYFRKRLWGTTYVMIRAVLTEREKWVRALSLDPVTGLDPSPSIKVRAAQGLDAASTFVPGYWIWTKVIENLACLDYDTNNLWLAAYDWRLSYGNLEVRDAFFSRLVCAIIRLLTSYCRKRDGKVVLVGHSMGATVITVSLSSLKWVEAEGHGDGGPEWVENHIEAVVSLAGTHLGVAKALTAFLSGEMRDTVELNPAGTYVLERFFSRKERAALFRAWAGAASLWIKGGNAIWGDSTGAPDDRPGSNSTFGDMISFRARSPSLHGEDVDITTDALGRPVPHIETNPGFDKLTPEQAGEYVLQQVPEEWQRMMQTNYSNGIERDEEQLKKNNQDPTKWTNPLEIQLPNAPSMKIYCVYGHGKETERSYWYSRGKYDQDIPFSDEANPVCLNSTDCSIDRIPPGATNETVPRPPLDMPLLRESWIDTAVIEPPEANPKVTNGVKIGEGDGTVSLISLGAMCVEGWKRKNWNPAGIKVTTVELPHLPDSLDPRGGATTGEHIDILGSTGLNEVLLKVASGRGHEIEDTFVSPIREYVKRMQWD
ncbi:phospholipid:diacylglycerol acyltransferase, partial [Clavulina sp. PMI_390]